MIYQLVFLHAGTLDLDFLHARHGRNRIFHLLHDALGERAVRGGELYIEVYIVSHNFDFLDESERYHVVVQFGVDDFT